MPYFQEIVVELKSEDDPFLLYRMRLDERDFTSLKNAQNLRVDFHQFAQMFLELLQRCSRQNKTSSEQKYSTLVFYHS